MANSVMLVIFSLIGLVLLVNIFKVFTNIFGASKVKKMKEDNPLRDEIRSEINEKIKPHLNSLEGMYEKSENDFENFSTYVFDKAKVKLAPLMEKDEKLVEEEICKCCGDYDSAECKENFCLEGSGISCEKS